MATSKDEVKVTLKAEKAKQFQSDMHKSGGAVDHLGKTTEKAAARSELFGKANEHVNKTLFRMGTLLGFAELSLGGALVEGAKKSMEAFEESQKVQAQTAAVLRSTGHAAGVTSKDITALAQSLSLKVGIDDEAIQSSENLLLTFRQIRDGGGKTGKVFQRTTRDVLDMSVAMHKDLNSSAILVGKALNNPINGLSRLQRVGVQFTTGQEKQIKSLTRHGHAAKAQRVILRELEKEFGRSAIAAGKTSAGALNRLKVIINNVEEEIGKALAPTVDRAIDKLSKFALQVQNNVGSGGRFRQEVLKIADAIRHKIIPDLVTLVKTGYNVLKWVQFSATDFKVLLGIWFGFAILIKAAAWVKTFTAAIELLDIAMDANVVALVVIGIMALVTAVILAYRKCTWFRNAVNNVFNWIKTHWPLLLGILGGPFGALLVLVIKHFGAIERFVRKMPGRLASAATGMWDWIKTGAVNAINFVIGKVNWLIRAFNSTLGKVPGVPNVGQLAKVGQQSLTSANTKAYKGYQGIPSGRGAGGAGASGILANPMTVPKLINHVSVRLDSKDITASTLKSTRDKVRRR